MHAVALKNIGKTYHLDAVDVPALVASTSTSGRTASR